VCLSCSDIFRGSIRIPSDLPAQLLLLLLLLPVMCAQDRNLSKRAPQQRGSAKAPSDPQSRPHWDLLMFASGCRWRSRC